MTIKQLGGVFGRNPTFNNVTIDGDLTVDGTVIHTGDLTIDNINISGNTISSTNTNGNIILDPNGTGYSLITAPTNGTIAQYGDTSSRTFFVKQANVGGYDNANLIHESDSGVGQFQWKNSTRTLATLTNAGNLAFPSGQGIDFSATAGAGSTSELLDDYEEGLYDITATDTGGGATIVLKSYTNELRYTKIGSLVHVHGRVQVDSVTGAWSGALSINLPFVPDTAESTGSVMTQYADYTSGSPVCVVSEGSSALVFYASNPSAGVSLVQVPANQYVAFSIQYVAA